MQMEKHSSPTPLSVDGWDLLFKCLDFSSLLEPCYFPILPTMMAQGLLLEWHSVSQVLLYSLSVSIILLHFSQIYRAQWPVFSECKLIQPSTRRKILFSNLIGFFLPIGHSKEQSRLTKPLYVTEKTCPQYSRKFKSILSQVWRLE